MFSFVKGRFYDTRNIISDIFLNNNKKLKITDTLNHKSWL